MNRGIRRATFSVAAGLAMTCAAFGQDLGSDQLARIERQLRDRPAPLPATEIEPDAPIPDAAEAEILPIASVVAVDRDGALLTPQSGLPVAAIEAELSALIGTDTTTADVIRAHDAVRRLLREEGFLFTAVGDVQLSPGAGGAALLLPIAGVTVARAEAVDPSGGAVPPWVVEKVDAYLAPLRGKLNPTLADLERASLLAGDLPGVVRATFVPSAGEASGELLLFMNLEFERWNAVLFADNRQANALGPILAGAVFSLNSWADLAATTEIAAFNSLNYEPRDLDVEERHTLQLTQRIWPGDAGTMLEAQALYSVTEPGDELAPLGLESDEIRFAARVEHPLMRTRALSVWASAGFEWSEATTELSTGAELSNDVLSVAHLGLRAAQRDATGYTAGDVQLRVGLDVLGANDANSPNPSRAGADGGFTSIRLNLEREQLIGEGISLFARASAQYSQDPLLSSEQITSGGSLYSKAYDPSEITGDSGVQLYGEIRYDFELEPLEGVPLDLQAYGFGDYARVSRTDDPTFDYEELVSTGFGLRASWENTAAAVEFAQPVSDQIARNADKDPRYFFTLSQRF